MTKAALLEHIATSGSWLMIFLTRDTGIVRLVGWFVGRDGDVRGSWVWPVGSLRGGMALVL